MLWQRAYEVKILDGHREIVGRGPTQKPLKRSLNADGLLKGSAHTKTTSCIRTAQGSSRRTVTS